jgi:hypothetical protein
MAVLRVLTIVLLTAQAQAPDTPALPPQVSA